MMTWKGETSPSQHSSSPFAGKPRLSPFRAPVPERDSGIRASRVTDRTPPIPWPTLHPATFHFQIKIKYLLLLIKPPRQSPAPCMASTLNSWGCFCSPSSPYFTQSCWAEIPLAEDNFKAISLLPFLHPKSCTRIKPQTPLFLPGDAHPLTLCQIHPSLPEGH